MNTQELLEKSIEKFQKTDYRGVIQYLDRVLQVNPEEGDIYGHRCFARYKLGDREGAIADCQQAARLYLSQGKAKEHQYSLTMLRKLQAQE